MQSEQNLLVDMQHVLKRYPLFTLDRVSLALPEGEVMGLVGPNGAGKSTLLRLLLGFIRADEGRIRVLGHDIPQQGVAVKQSAAYVSEDMRLYQDKSIGWHMRFLSKCFDRWDSAYAQHILKRFQLKEDQVVKHLSLGERIKTNLLLALSRRPRLLALDEPSTGLDPVARHELTSTLIELMLDERNSVIFSSQFTQDVERLSDTITFIDQGRLISSQDKERYLDQWKRIEITLPANADVPAGFYCVNRTTNSASIVDSHFKPERLEAFQQAGYAVMALHNLTLEEIFIHQVLMQRQNNVGGR